MAKERNATAAAQVEAAPIVKLFVAIPVPFAALARPTTRVARLALLILVFGNASTASAALGAQAARGDNCTPFNSFKVGYAVPGGTIVQQSIILVDGWLVAGWILRTVSGKRYYLPNPRYFDHSVDEYNVAAGPPAFALIQAPGPDALNRAYREIRKVRRAYSQHVDRDSLPDLPAATLVEPCFAEPLRL